MRRNQHHQCCAETLRLYAAGAQIRPSLRQTGRCHCGGGGRIVVPSPLHDPSLASLWSHTPVVAVSLNGWSYHLRGSPVRSRVIGWTFGECDRVDRGRQCSSVETAAETSKCILKTHVHCFGIRYCVPGKFHAAAQHGARLQVTGVLPNPTLWTTPSWFCATSTRTLIPTTIRALTVV